MDYPPEKVLENLLDKLGELAGHSVSVLPDFFIDRIVVTNRVFSELVEDLRRVAERKGGNIVGVREEIIRGGNAANTASALGALGVRVYPILITGRLGRALLEYFLTGMPVDLSYVKTWGRESMTVALETIYNGERVNIMISDSGSLECFSIEHLEERDFELLERVELVGFFNWAQNKCANKLLKGIREHVKTPLFLDTSDPRIVDNRRVSELIDLLMKGYVDYLSLNENEAVFYAEKLGYKSCGKRLVEEAYSAAKYLSEYLSVEKIFLHTTRYTAVFPSGEIASVFKVEPVRVTGAGDTWNAGVMAGILLGLKDYEKIVLANSVAACYITRVDGRHCGVEELREFLSSNPGILGFPEGLAI